MSKKITKRTKRRLLLITTVTIFVVIAFIVNAFALFSQVVKSNKDTILLREQMNDLADKEEYLKVEVEKLNDPEYIAKYAREKYLYSKAGEFTIKMP